MCDVNIVLEALGVSNSGEKYNKLEKNSQDLCV